MMIENRLAHCGGSTLGAVLGVMARSASFHSCEKIASSHPGIIRSRLFIKTDSSTFLPH
jgi:hypothetical protein